MNKNIKKDFPIFQNRVNDHDFIYFDSASAQTAAAVVDAMASYYESYRSNVGRGIYHYAEVATARYEAARQTVADFIGAEKDEIIFTSGTTAGINQVAGSWARHHLKAGDEIVISDVEHHSNLLPWQQLAEEKDISLTIISVNNQGIVDPQELQEIISEKTKLVALFYTSNMLGTTNDIAALAEVTHGVGARLFVDAAQAVAHKKIDMKQNKADFLVFRGHKLFGPTGIGVLYASRAAHKEMEPCSFGGGMVYSVTQKACSWKTAPHCFEAGTPFIAGAIGLAKAVEWFKAIDYVELQKHETGLVHRFVEGLLKIPQITVVSHVPQEGETSNLVTFYAESVHAHDIAAHLDQYGIAVRAGNHCVQPYHDKKGFGSTVRASFSLYNTKEEVDFALKSYKIFSSWTNSHSSRIDFQSFSVFFPLAVFSFVST